MTPRQRASEARLLRSRLFRERVENRLEVEIHRAEWLPFDALPFAIGKRETESRVKSGRVVIRIGIVERIHGDEPRAESRAKLAGGVAECPAHKRGAQPLCVPVHREQADFHGGEGAILHVLIPQQRMLHLEAIGEQRHVAEQAIRLARKPALPDVRPHFACDAPLFPVARKFPAQGAETRCARWIQRIKLFDGNARPIAPASLAIARSLRLAPGLPQLRDDLRRKLLCARIAHGTPSLHGVDHPSRFAADNRRGRGMQRKFHAESLQKSTGCAQMNGGNIFRFWRNLVPAIDRRVRGAVRGGVGKIQLEFPMKTFLTAVALSCLVFPIFAADQNPTSAQGCVVYKRPVDAGASMVEYRSYRDLGTNIGVIGVTGEEVRVFGEHEPIFIPYPSDATADPQAVIALIQQARTRYPELSRRLAVIEKAWAAVPRKRVLVVAPTPMPKVQATPEKAGIEIVTITGIKYRNVTISLVEPDGLMVMTDAGVQKIAFVTLSPEMQKKYGYNPEAAAAFTAALALAEQANAQRTRQVREEEQRRMTEKAQAEEGRRIAVAKQLAIREEESQKQDSLRAIKTMSEIKSIRVTQVMDNGVLAHLATAAEAVPAGANGGAKYQRTGDWQDEVVFIYLNNTKRLLDGSEFGGRLYPVGRLQYTSVLGATKTVASYAVNPETALEMIRSTSGKDSDK